MSGRKPSALSPLNRALFWTQVVMVWERILPALFPYVLLFALVAVALCLYGVVALVERKLLSWQERSNV